MMIYFGVLTYKNRDLSVASNNIGDYVQSLAAINIYRKFLEDYYHTTFSIEEFLEKLLNNSFPDFHFVLINRDSFSELIGHPIYGQVKITVILNGWWMRGNGLTTPNNTFDFPFPKNVDPIFVSFHVADQRMLTSEGVEYLKEHAPIGCRDTYTLNLLKQRGVEGYFSGCLTKSIDFYKHNHATTSGRVYVVDVDISGDGSEKELVHVAHSQGEHVNGDGGKMLKKALSLLKNYSTSDRVITTRLHCYMPCFAMGVPVELRSKNGSSGQNQWGTDPRFQGLLFNVTDLDRPAGNVALEALEARYAGK